MEERFKRYLEEQFRQIAPTRSAMEYRKTMLMRMLDRAQELRIKGVNDEELIYNMVIGELGDFAQKLRDYENDTVNKVVARRKAFFTTIITISYVFLITLVFLIVGGVTHRWHPAWLILVGGILLGLTFLSTLSASVSVKKKAFVPARIFSAGCIVFISTLIFLILQLVVRLSGSWMTFLAMVIAVAGVDTVFVFAHGGNWKWIQLPIFAEILCVMLYVILGICLSANGIANIWHPGWIMCLGGVVVALIESVVAGAGLSAKNKKKKTDDKTAVDESYWTQW